MQDKSEANAKVKRFKMEKFLFIFHGLLSEVGQLQKEDEDGKDPNPPAQC